MGKNRKLTIYPVTTDSSAQIRLSGYRVYQDLGHFCYDYARKLLFPQ